MLDFNGLLQCSYNYVYMQRTQIGMAGEVKNNQIQKNINLIGNLCRRGLCGFSDSCKMLTGALILAVKCCQYNLNILIMWGNGLRLVPQYKFTNKQEHVGALLYLY